jgi:hypothetical protein
MAERAMDPWLQRRLIPKPPGVAGSISLGWLKGTPRSREFSIDGIGEKREWITS